MVVTVSTRKWQSSDSPKRRPRPGSTSAAINTFRELSQHKDGQLPVDGLLMRLGRTEAEAGKTSDAEQTFNKLVAEYPDSSFAADARKELDQLKKAS